MYDKMQVFIVIGARGTGKSTLTEQRVKHAPKEMFKWIYDIEKRYGMPYIDIDVFAEKAGELKNSFIVYEEATIFFPNRGNNKDLRKTLVKSRYNENIIFMIYHSICAVPYYVYELTDCIILFRTQDEEERVIKKYKKLYPYYWRIKNRPIKCRQFKLLNGNISPYEIIKL